MFTETKRQRGHERHAAVHAVAFGSRGPIAKEPFPPLSQSPSSKSVKAQYPGWAAAAALCANGAATSGSRRSAAVDGASTMAAARAKCATINCEGCAASRRGTCALRDPSQATVRERYKYGVPTCLWG